MSLLHSLHRNVKTIAMPMGMVVGALLCRPVTAAESMSVSYTHLTLPTKLEV